MKSNIRMTRRTAVTALGFAAAALGVRSSLGAERARELDVIAFPGGFNLPIWAAEANGGFERRGIGVKLHFTPDSVTQMKGLLDGTYDIAMTAIDNVVAYHEGQGAVQASNGGELRAFVGADDGFLSLAVAPDIKSFADLRGRTLAVDALTTGYSFVLLELLARHGLKRSDVTLKSFGGVANRWETLKKGEHSGTLLVTPFEIMAKAAGFHVLAYARDFLGEYQGVVAAALSSTIEEDRTAMAAFAAAYREALAWLRVRDNEPAVRRILQEHLPQVPPQMLPAMLAELLADGHGFSATGDLNLPGIQTVIELRRKYNPPAKPLSEAKAYVMEGV